MICIEFEIWDLYKENILTLLIYWNQIKEDYRIMRIKKGLYKCVWSLKNK